MDIFKELTGIDLMDMQEQELKRRDQAEDAKKKRDAELKAKKEEEERRKKEEADAQLPEEERNKIAALKEATAFKDQGNTFYKQKKFDEALNFY